MMTECFFEHPLLCVWKAFPDPFTVGSHLDLSVIPLGWGLTTLLPSLPFKPDLSCDMPLCASPPFWLSVKWLLRNKIKEEGWHIHGPSGFLVTVMNGKKLLWFFKKSRDFWGQLGEQAGVFSLLFKLHLVHCFLLYSCSVQLPSNKEGKDQGSILSSEPMVPKLYPALGPPRAFKTQTPGTHPGTLIPLAWGGAWYFAFLTSFQMMLVLSPQLENPVLS